LLPIKIFKIGVVPGSTWFISTPLIFMNKMKNSCCTGSAWFISPLLMFHGPVYKIALSHGSTWFTSPPVHSRYIGLTIFHKVLRLVTLSKNTSASLSTQAHDYMHWVVS
jgi:hypothetical protein